MHSQQYPQDVQQHQSFQQVPQNDMFMLKGQSPLSSCKIYDGSKGGSQVKVCVGRKLGWMDGSTKYQTLKLNILSFNLEDLLGLN